MNDEMRYFWEVYDEYYSTEKLLHKSFNPLRDFEEEFIEGPILELGSGQSSLMIEYSIRGKDLIAIDNEDFQLKKLKTRIEEYAGTENLKKIEFLNRTIPNDEIPEKIFSVIIISNFLHFFTLKRCEEIIQKLLGRITSGSLIYLTVHSTKHPRNNPEDPNNNAYFQHYFSESDLNKLFPKDYFERIFFADMQQKKSEFDKKVLEKWYEKIFDSKGITSKEFRKKKIEEAFKDDQQAALSCIFRRK